MLIGVTTAVTAAAQTLKIHSGPVTVAVPANQAGDMTYSDGTFLTVMGKSWDIAVIDSITVDNSEVTDNAVDITYNGASAHVTVAGNVAPKLAVTVSGADVSVIAAADLQEEVFYTLSGTSDDGSFFMDGEFKATVTLNNLSLSNRRAGAIDIANGKRIDVILPTGTTTTLTDGTGGVHKACFFVNGHPEFGDGGRLVLTGNTKHAFASDEYTRLKKDFGTIEVLRAENDGMHVEQYFKMEGGTVNIRGTKGDCVDVSATKNITDEFNGQVFIEGGSLTMDVAADDVKGLKSDAEFTISGGTVTASVSGLGTKGISSGGNLLINQTSGNASLVKMTVTGTTYMSGDPLLESKCRGIKVKGEFTFDGGTIDIIATGAKSKAISCDGNYYYRSGSINCYVDAPNA